MASSSWVLVDDADPRIQYSPGWQAFVNGSEVDGTKHGAASAGLTASFSFTGTQVTVVGSLGSVDVHGIPTSLYTLDGAQVGLYTAPVVAPGLFQLNVTFFSSKTLAPGDHTLVITNVNGTSPNVFWLDYVEYVPSAAASTTTTTTSSSESSKTSAQSLATSSTATANNQAGSSAASHTHTGAIAGGVVGGIALLLALAALLVYPRRRRKGAMSTSSGPPVRPFGSWREAQNHIDLPASSPSQKQMMASVSMPTLSATSITSPTHTGLSPYPSPSARPSPQPHPPPSASDSPLTERERLSASERATPSSRVAGTHGSREPQVVQTVDSGLRLAGPGEAVMLPPPYTRE